MCGRYNLRTPATQLATLFDFSEPPPLSPRFNIAPTQPVAAVRLAQDSEHRECVLLRWGLIPSWAKDPAIGNRMINARSETAATKPSFRAPFRKRRCLIPADGFYEWQKQPGSRTKLPYHIHRRDDQTFAFAGLWDHWHSPDNEEIESCTILTTDANELLAPIHDRMPVIVEPAAYGLWLDREIEDAEALSGLLKPCPPEQMTATRISTWVNCPKHDDPRCIKPAAVEQQLFDEE